MNLNFVESIEGGCSINTFFIRILSKTLKFNSVPFFVFPELQGFDIWSTNWFDKLDIKQQAAHSRDDFLIHKLRNESMIDFVGCFILTSQPLLEAGAGCGQTVSSLI